MLGVFEETGGGVKTDVVVYTGGAAEAGVIWVSAKLNDCCLYSRINSLTTMSPVCPVCLTSLTATASHMFFCAAVTSGTNERYARENFRKHLRRDGSPLLRTRATLWLWSCSLS